LDEFLEHKLKIHDVEPERRQELLEMAKYLKCDPFSADKEECKKYEKGVELLFKHFHSLWI
jgi:hypothetical protein